MTGKKKEPQDLIIEHSFDKKLQKLMGTRGLSSADLLYKGKSFDLEESVVKIEYEGKDRVKRISTDKQLGFYDKILASKMVTSKWLTCCIGSYPSDLRAKQLAVSLFHEAFVSHHKVLNSSVRFHRALPLWHRIYSGFGDSLRDLKTEPPSFIVISNINLTSSDQKLEKARDILEKYNALGVPVVVVCGGIDPLALFQNRLNYPLKYGIYLGSGDK